MIKKKDHSRKASSLPDLPWWVELLFVQIGLPDSWLRNLLKTKKTTKRIIVDNKYALAYAILAFGIVTYTYPIIKQAELNNSCINNSSDYVRAKIKNSEIIDKKLLLAISTRFCNGGDI